jgi:hypothetical protein
MAVVVVEEVEEEAEELHWHPANCSEALVAHRESDFHLHAAYIAT